jgi:hypothetical protein
MISITAPAVGTAHHNNTTGASQRSQTEPRSALGADGVVVDRGDQQQQAAERYSDFHVGGLLTAN